MSHVANINLTIDDIPLLMAVCKDSDLFTFMENQKTWKWYGSWQNDYDAEDAAYKNGIPTEDYGKCSHAIKVKGASYEIGLYEISPGVYKPVWDFWSSGGLKTEHIAALKLEYNKRWIQKQSKKNGLRSKVTRKNGKTYVEVSR